MKEARTHAVEALRGEKALGDHFGELMVVIVQHNDLQVSERQLGAHRMSAAEQGRTNLIDVKVATALERVVASMDDERTGDAVDVQSATVSVPPLVDSQRVSVRRRRRGRDDKTYVSAVLVDIVDEEAVCVADSRPDWALRDAGRTILPLRPVLVQAVPVQRDCLR